MIPVEDPGGKPDHRFGLAAGSISKLTASTAGCNSTSVQTTRAISAVWFPHP